MIQQPQQQRDEQESGGCSSIRGNEQEYSLLANYIAHKFGNIEQFRNHIKSYLEAKHKYYKNIRKHQATLDILENALQELRKSNESVTIYNAKSKPILTQIGVYYLRRSLGIEDEILPEECNNLEEFLSTTWPIVKTWPMRYCIDASAEDKRFIKEFNDSFLYLLLSSVNKPDDVLEWLNEQLPPRLDTISSVSVVRITIFICQLYSHPNIYKLLAPGSRSFRANLCGLPRLTRGLILLSTMNSIGKMMITGSRIPPQLRTMINQLGWAITCGRVPKMLRK